MHGIEDGVGNTGYEGDGFSYNPIDTSPAVRSGVTPLVVAISAVIGILLLIILAAVLIRCRRNKELKAISEVQRSSGSNMNGGGRRTTDTLLSAASRGSSFAATNGSIRSRKSSHPNGNGSLGNTLLRPSSHSKNNGLIYDPDRYGNRSRLWYFWLYLSDTYLFVAIFRLSLTDYENGVLPLPPPDPLLAGIGNGVAIRPMAMAANGATLSRHHSGAATGRLLHSHDSNDSSDSWMGSSRSRETSPESSIPPGMAPFRVIPLHSAESESRSLSADPGGKKINYFNYYSMWWNSHNFNIFRTPGVAFTTLNGGSVRGSEAGSNPSDHWAEVNGKPFGSAQQPQPPDGTPSSNGSTQPLLRRNQYWVNFNLVLAHEVQVNTG